MAARRRDCDVAIIGAGHNGLVCAAYLARAGLSVRVFERRPVVGGAAFTEEFHPGFRNSLAAYTVSLLNPKIISDLDLHRHGLRIVLRPIANMFPAPDRPPLVFHRDRSATARAIGRLSARDAAVLPDYLAALESIADLLRDLVLETPPDPGGGWREVLKTARLANRLRRLHSSEQRLLLDLFTRSASDFLAEWFEHDAVKAAFAFDGIVGTFASPATPGTAYVLLHHAFGEVNGERGAWGHAIGGMGAISDALRREAERHGAVIETEAEVTAIAATESGIEAVVLADGRTVTARVIASNATPDLLYRRLIDPALLSADFHRAIASRRYESASFRMNVALDALPRFTALAGLTEEERRAHLASGIVIAPSMAYLEDAYHHALREGMSRAPVIEMLIPSVLDPTLAPEGRHVASLFCQHFRYALPDGRSWDDAREEAADLVLATMEAHAPGFSASVLARRILSPLDLERELSLTRGDIFHGALSLDQMWSARPLLGIGSYRGALPGLYHCGAGAHPGGGVTGLAGHNAAREIVRDLGLLRRFPRS